MYTLHEIYEALNDPDPNNPIAIALAAKLKEFTDDFERFMREGGDGKDYKIVVNNGLEHVAASMLKDVIDKQAKGVKK